MTRLRGEDRASVRIIDSCLDFELISILDAARTMLWNVIEGFRGVVAKVRDGGCLLCLPRDSPPDSSTKSRADKETVKTADHVGSPRRSRQAGESFVAPL